MQRMMSALIVLLCLTLQPIAAAGGWFFDDTLVTIDGIEYTADDFEQWWKFWKEEGEALPKTPEPYIDWLLLKQEGERMDLANDPAFKRQERIYLMSRGLLMLKYDAVDSQIDITDDMIKARYNEKYAPRWLVQRMRFTTEEAALATWQEFSDQTLDVDTFLENPGKESQFEGHGQGWMRPKDVDPGWVELFESSEAGSVIDPEKHNKGRLLYRVKERQAGDGEDLATVKEEIRKNLWKEEEDRLTAQLLRNLEKEYQVQIDEERLAAIDINAPRDTFTDDPVITTSRENVSEKQFMAVIEKLLLTRPTAIQAKSDPELAKEFKLETARNIIAQSVTNWASLDRHFEKEEPFKSAYDFNYNHRLVTMVEQRLFKTKEDLTEKELEQYFQDNIRRYTVPAQAKLYIIAETLGPIEQIWADVAVGKQFEQVVKQYLGHSVQPIEAPINHLDPEVKAVAQKLVDGETSQIFVAQGDRVLVHLVKRTPEQPLMFAKVKDSIRSEIKREHFFNTRDEYLNKIKAQLQVDVREDQWKSIQKELGGKR